jgi:hypothetical protein
MATLHRFLLLDVVVDVGPAADAFCQAQVDAIFGWAEAADRRLSDGGVTGRMGVTLTAVPSEELLALLSSGRAFRVDSMPPLPLGDAPELAQGFARGTLTIITDPPEGAA